VIIIKLPEYLLEAIEAGDVKKFYKSGVWKNKREQILKRDNFECQRCKRNGEFSKAKVVHHIKHLDEFPELALDDDNLESLCKQCHNKEHPEKYEKFKDNWQKRNKPDIPERW